MIFSKYTEARIFCEDIGHHPLLKFLSVYLVPCIDLCYYIHASPKTSS